MQKCPRVILVLAHTHTANLQILACEERAHAVMAMLQSPVVGLAVVLPAFMKLECETV